MFRPLSFAIVLLALLARLALAQPAVSVRYETGAAIIQLEGDYANQWYSVSRGDTREGPWTPLTESSVLCLGACAVTDDGASAGRTYWYQFDLQLADGSFTRYGPYSVTISAEIAKRIRVAVFPQPVRGPARIEIQLAGVAGDAPVEVRALLFDLQGRRVRVVHQGMLARGRTSLAWDGAAEGGRGLAAGLYLLRVESALGSAITRVVRSR